MSVPADLLKRCWFVAGPTAVGKTGAALHLAGVLNAEILSMDSMAVYRRMDIGTAKPSREEQQQVRHHLIDLINPDQEFSLSDYVQHAALAIEDVVSRGHTPLFVGGTGLYLRSLLRGVFSGPDADWELRERLEQQQQMDQQQQVKQ
jgi:tRNA dimethylallyltransferase